MRKLWITGIAVIVAGCPCGCAATAETWAWAAAWNIVAAVLESLQTAGGVV